MMKEKAKLISWIYWH